MRSVCGSRFLGFTAAVALLAGGLLAGCDPSSDSSSAHSLCPSDHPALWSAASDPKNAMIAICKGPSDAEIINTSTLLMDVSFPEENYVYSVSDIMAPGVPGAVAETALSTIVSPGIVPLIPGAYVKVPLAVAQRVQPEYDSNAVGVDILSRWTTDGIQSALKKSGYKDNLEDVQDLAECIQDAWDSISNFQYGSTQFMNYEFGKAISTVLKCHDVINSIFGEPEGGPDEVPNVTTDAGQDYTEDVDSYNSKDGSSGTPDESKFEKYFDDAE